MKSFINFLPPWVETNLQPAFYDVESGTCLQQTARMYNKVNELVRKFNELDERFSAIENYFDNLDVQEEINNKLDAMVADGTMEALLQDIANVSDVFYFHTVMATKYFRSSDEEAGMQGGCVLPDNTIIQCTGNNNYGTGKILHYAQDGTLLNATTVDYGHCNGVTYNSKTGHVMITSTQSNTLGRYMIYEVDPTTLDEIATYDCSDKDFPAEQYGIVYIEEEDNYIFVNYWQTSGVKYMWKTDAEFNVIETKEIDVEVRSTSNIGRFGKYIGVNTITDRNVMLFNIDMSFFKEINLAQTVSDTWCITEAEWFDTRNNKVYMGFIPASATSPLHWGGGTKVFAVFDQTLNYNEVRKTGTQFAPYGEIYYVDDTKAYNPLRDGSADAPFENINEALNASLRTENITGDVLINIKQSGTPDTFYPFFSMSKMYKVVVDADSSTNVTFGGIFVNRNAKVAISKGVSLTPTTTTYSDCNVFVRGDLLVDGVLKINDGSQLVIGGDNSATITAKIDNVSNGIDFTRFYGKFVNLGTESIPATSSSTFLTLRTTASTSLMTMKLLNIRTTQNMISEGSETYQIPNYAPITNVMLRVNLPNGSGGTAITHEPVLTYNQRLYTEYRIPYLDTDNSWKFLQVKISDQGVLSFGAKPTGGLQNLRIRTITSE